MPRKMDDLEMAKRIVACGMKGYIAKSHYFCTAERAKLVNKIYPTVNVVGSITLNNAVGGLNWVAVEMATMPVDALGIMTISMRKLSVVSIPMWAQS